MLTATDVYKRQTCRFADTLAPEMDKLKAEAAKWATQEEDVLTYAMFPQEMCIRDRCTTGLENYAVPLGLGKWITSVTMTLFYVLPVSYTHLETLEVKNDVTAGRIARFPDVLTTRHADVDEEQLWEDCLLYTSRCV